MKLQLHDKSDNRRSRSLQLMRGKIETLDKEIILILAKRLSLMKKIGTTKKNQGSEINDPSRELYLSNLHRKWSKKAGIDPIFAGKIFDVIFTESKKIQHNQQSL